MKPYLLKLNPVVSLFPTNILTHMCMYLHTGTFFAALFTMAEHRNSLSVHKLWFICTNEHYVDSTENGNGLHVLFWNSPKAQQFPVVVTKDHAFRGLKNTTLLCYRCEGEKSRISFNGAKVKLLATPSPPGDSRASAISLPFLASLACCSFPHLQSQQDRIFRSWAF